LRVAPGGRRRAIAAACERSGARSHAIGMRLRRPEYVEEGKLRKTLKQSSDRNRIPIELLLSVPVDLVIPLIGTSDVLIDLAPDAVVIDGGHYSR
jgi:hypothetical protein